MPLRCAALRGRGAAPAVAEGEPARRVSRGLSSFWCRAAPAVAPRRSAAPAPRSLPVVAAGGAEVPLQQGLRPQGCCTRLGNPCVVPPLALPRKQPPTQTQTVSQLRARCRPAPRIARGCAAQSPPGLPPCCAAWRGSEASCRRPAQPRCSTPRQVPPLPCPHVLRLVCKQPCRLVGRRKLFPAFSS